MMERLMLDVDNIRRLRRRRSLSTGFVVESVAVLPTRQSHPTKKNNSPFPSDSESNRPKPMDSWDETLDPSEILP